MPYLPQQNRGTGVGLTFRHCSFKLRTVLRDGCHHARYWFCTKFVLKIEDNYDDKSN